MKQDNYFWDKFPNFLLSNILTCIFTDMFVFISDIWFYCWKSWRYSYFNSNFTITTLSQPTDYHRSLIQKVSAKVFIYLDKMMIWIFCCAVSRIYSKAIVLEFKYWLQIKLFQLIVVLDFLRIQATP